VLWKDDYVHKSQGEENPTNSINQNEEFSKVEIACHEFYRVIFDPGGIQAINSRSNSLEEGEYDENLILSHSTRDNFINGMKLTKSILIPSVIFVGDYMTILFLSYLEFWMFD